jgi:hypothetical protein
LLLPVAGSGRFDDGTADAFHTSCVASALQRPVGSSMNWLPTSYFFVLLLISSLRYFRFDLQWLKSIL